MVRFSVNVCVLEITVEMSFHKYQAAEEVHDALVSAGLGVETCYNDLVITMAEDLMVIPLVAPCGVCKGDRNQFLFCNG